jgi:hypothetical protein
VMNRARQAIYYSAPSAKLSLSLREDFQGLK